MDTSLIFNIVPRLLPTFILGLVAVIGLLILKRNFNDIITGTIKTMAGILILFVAIDVLNGVINTIASLFSYIYKTQGRSATADWTTFLSSYSLEIILVMVLGFLINLLLARITKWKYVFLTGHIMFWNAFMIVAALVDEGVENGLTLIILGSLLQGFFSILFPALISPFVFKLTNTKDFTIGHTTTILSVIGALLGKWFGDTSQSSEDLELPQGLSFMKSMTVMTTIITFIIFLLMGFIVGVDKTSAALTGGITWLWYPWIILQSILFGAGLIILLTGVRMMLAEIVPAFNGIARKIVPNAIPALDCPMLFTYGENALMIGFLVALLTSSITLIIFSLAGYPYLLLPLVVAAFFDVGPAAVLANKTGGLRGVILASAIGGILLIVFQALSLPFLMNTAAGFINAFGGNDFSIIGILIGGSSRIISGLLN